MDKQEMIAFIKEKKGYDDRQAIKAAYQVRLFLRLILYVVALGVILGLLGFLKEALIIFAAMKLYRSCSGGIHLSNGIKCFIWSFITILGIILVSKYLVMPIVVEVVLLVYTVLIWYWYIPQGTSQRPLRNEVEKRRMRLGMLVFIAITVGVKFINEDVFRLCLLSLCVTVTCTTPVVYKLVGANYDRYKSC